MFISKIGQEQAWYPGKVITINPPVPYRPVAMIKAVKVPELSQLRSQLRNQLRTEGRRFRVEN